MKKRRNIQTVLTSRLRRVVSNRERVMRTGTPGSVHDLRVATRRLQEALDFFAPSLPSRDVGRLRKRVRKIRKDLGQTRNSDVLVGLVKDLHDRLPDADKGILKSTLGHLRHEAARLRRPRGSRCRIDVPAVERRTRKIESSLHALEGFSVTRRALEILEQRFAEIVTTLQQAAKGGADELHRLRISIKKLRYTLELLGDAGIGSALQVVSGLKSHQTRLGDLHDLDVLIQMITAGSIPGDAVGRRKLLPYLERRRKAQAARTIQALTGFHPETAAQAVMKELREMSA